jgi:hypothetical protein
MRTTWAMALLGLIIAGLAAANKGAATNSRPADRRFVVHEWGTFTSFSGSDSVKLEFRPLADVDLPQFVVNRAQQSGTFNPFGKADLSVLQRMETPVTYFYTDRPLQAKVRVDFPQGLLTEFFPPVENIEPAFDGKQPEKVGRSSLDWGRIWLIPPDRLHARVENAALDTVLSSHILDKLLPSAASGDHYSLARETDSDIVYVERNVDPKHPFAPRGGFFERFLFYRGVGNFELPLQLSAISDDRFELRNLGSSAVRSLFLVAVDGKNLRFQHYAGIQPGQRLTLVQSARAATIDELCQSVTRALVDEKLYEKEARAMVNTWRDSWFSEQGTRLFYFLPAQLTNAILPLAIDPQPAEIVRVMVGRMEIMSPADEARIGKLVKQSASDREAAVKVATERGEAAAYSLPPQIIDLGRLAEPALVRVKTLAKDPVVRSEAELLLWQLRQFREESANRQPIAE